MTRMRIEAMPDRVLVLGAVCLAGLMMPLSFTGPAVATPAIARELGGSAVALGWIVNAFVLSFGSCVMAAGALADQFGRKRIFRIGVAGFAVLSLAVACAPSVIALDLLRGAQGVAAALAMSAGAAALAQEFEGAARTRAFSLLGTTFGIGLALGPVWSGFLIETLGWRAVFLSGTALGLLVLAFGVPRMRETRDPGATGIDWPGTVTFTATLVLLTFGIVQGPQSGWGSPATLALLLGAALLLATFIAVERRQRRPMLDLSLFRYRRFVGVQFLPVATAFSFVVLLIVLPIRFIGIDGYSETEAGLLMIALCAPMAVVPFLAALLTRWVPASLLSALGLAIAAGGILWLSFARPGAPLAATVLPMLVIGAGTGLPWGLMDDLSVSVVPKERAGMATGIFTTMRVAGEAVVLALVGALLIALLQHGLAETLAGQGPAVLAKVPALANDLAGGALGRAVDSLPGTPAELLRQVHAEAFAAMLRALAAATLAAAALSFAVLNAGARRRVPACGT